MGGRLRIILCATLLLLIPLYLLIVDVEDFNDRSRAGTYLIDWVKSQYLPQSIPALPHRTTKEAVIVMAALEEEHTEWVKEELPEYVDRFCAKSSTNLPQQLAARNIHC
jgi:hypothetical protein